MGVKTLKKGFIWKKDLKSTATDPAEEGKKTSSETKKKGGR